MWPSGRKWNDDYKDGEADTASETNWQGGRQIDREEHRVTGTRRCCSGSKAPNNSESILLPHTASNQSVQPLYPPHSLVSTCQQLTFRSCCRYLFFSSRPAQLPSKHHLHPVSLYLHSSLFFFLPFSPSLFLCIFILFPSFLVFIIIF